MTATRGTSATLSHTVGGYRTVTTPDSIAVTVVGTGTGFLRIVLQAETDLGTTEDSATIAHTVTRHRNVTSGPTVTANEDEDETPTLGR